MDLLINPFAKEKDEPACLAGDGFFPFFCFITLIKLRQQNVTCASRNILTCKKQPSGKIRKLQGIKL